MNLTVKLPDGSQRQYQKRIRSLDIAQEIGPGLAKAAIAAEIDGQQVDLSTLLPADGQVTLRIITKKDPQALAIMRHSCACDGAGRDAAVSGRAIGVRSND